jgi:hypothetical protein
MKVKHIIISHFAVALILLAGCAAINHTPSGELLDRALLERQVAAIRKQNRKGDCHIHALYRVYFYQSEGIPYRLCIGKYKGKMHAWCEYYENGKWLLDDKAQGIKGWERSKVRGYSPDAAETVPDYRIKG